MEFEWNEEKASGNIKKHDISFEEASSAFFDFYAEIIYDDVNSGNEDRFILIGFSENNKLLYISFIERNDKIRIISARKATKLERKKYGTRN